MSSAGPQVKESSGRRDPSTSASEKTNSSLPHIAALDGLRGVAVLVVIAFHHFSGLGSKTLSGGFIGVDVFFVLSGFLITGLLLEGHARTGRVVSVDFWERRIRRLLPALIVFLALIAVYAVAFAPAYRLGAIRYGSLATLFYVQNYWQLHATHIEGVPLIHTWTLSIEEQFYFVWPFVLALVVAATRGRARRQVGAILGLALLSAALMALRYRAAAPYDAYQSLDTRAHQMLVGAALAASIRIRPGPLSAGARRLLDLAAIASMIWIGWLCTSLNVTDAWLFRGGYLAIATASAVVIAAAVQPESGVARVLAFRPLVGIGVLSYGAYLFHIPINYILSEDTIANDLGLAAARALVVLAIALACYRFIEQPIRARRIGRNIWRLALASIASAVVIIVLVTRGAVAPPPWAGAQLFYFRQAELTGPNDTRVLVVGDVLAMSLGDSDPYVAEGVRGLTASSYGCGLLRGELVVAGALYAQPPCRVQLDAFAAAVRSYAPHVVVAMFGSVEVFDIQLGSKTFRFGTTSYETELHRRMDQMRAILTRNGARLVIATTPCMEPESVAGFEKFAELRRDPARVAWLNEAWTRYAAGREDVRVADLDQEVCPDSQRRSTQSGAPISSADGIGFNKPGGLEVWDWLAPLAIDARESGHVDAPRFDE